MASQRWQRACQRSSSVDAYAGIAGALLAAAEMEASDPGCLPRAFTRRLLEVCEAAAREYLRLAHEGRPSLGLSHGLAGVLLALETGYAALGQKSSSSLRARCLEAIAISRDLWQRDARRGILFQALQAFKEEKGKDSGDALRLSHRHFPESRPHGELL